MCLTILCWDFTIHFSNKYHPFNFVVSTTLHTIFILPLLLEFYLLSHSAFIFFSSTQYHIFSWVHFDFNSSLSSDTILSILLSQKKGIQLLLGVHLDKLYDDFFVLETTGCYIDIYIKCSQRKWSWECIIKVLRDFNYWLQITAGMAIWEVKMWYPMIKWAAVLISIAQIE